MNIFLSFFIMQNALDLLKMESTENSVNIFSFAEKTNDSKMLEKYQ